MHSTPAWTLLIGALGLVFAATRASAQVHYHEDFRPSLTSEGDETGVEGSDTCYPGNAGPGMFPFAEGWLLRNVDNLVPETPSAYVTDAWIVREEIAGEPRNCVAISTSWYAPFGTADDWMWTPAIPIPDATAVLSWRARPSESTFRDGYEVRIMLAADGPPSGGIGDIGNQLSASTQVFSIANEFPGWQARNVSLAAYAGQSIHVAFRNATTHANKLLIDDVMVRSPGLNLAAQVPTVPYYVRMPRGATISPSLSATARNTGTPVLTNVAASATVTRDGVDTGTPVASGVAAILGADTSTALAFAAPGATFSGDGLWRVRYDVSAAESSSEADPTDNSVVSLPTIVGGSEFSRHAGTRVGTIGLGASAEVGVAFRLDQSTRVAGIRFEVSPSVPTAVLPDYPYHALIRAMESGRPGALLATTLDYAYPLVANGDNERVVDAGFIGGPVTLPAGSYVATVAEPPEVQMHLHTYAARFAPGQTWIGWSTNNQSPDHWSNLEAFGVGYRRMPAISLLTDLALFRDGLEDTGAP